jgi:hypothetical protein
MTPRPSATSTAQSGPTTGCPPSNLGSSIGAIVCGVVALLICPILLGPAGIVLGVFALRRNESLAKVGIGVAVGGMIGGFILGAALATTN